MTSTTRIVTDPEMHRVRQSMLVKNVCSHLPSHGEGILYHMALFVPQRRLGDAAKKAISKLQVRTIRKGDQETENDFDNCAVCIEGYKANDVVRILPCR